MKHETKIPEFIEIRIESWEDLIKFFNKFKWSSSYGRDWIFRGQSKHTYSLSPSLERLCRDNLLSISQQEKLSLSHFKRRYRGKFKPKNSLEWLSLMQHYGAPTRLLDFTYSWYIALFFAVESLTDKDEDDDASLWCINLKELKKGIKNAIKIEWDENIKHVKLFKIYEKEACAFIDNQDQGKNVVIPVEPNSLHDRIHIQQGLFLINGSWETTFEDTLFKTLDVKKEECETKNIDDIKKTMIEEVKIFKLIINKDKKKEMITELFRMNISRESLYQGIEGFAQSIKTRIQAGIYLD
jgi:hypothetical protein